MQYGTKVRWIDDGLYIPYKMLQNVDSKYGNAVLTTIQERADEKPPDVYKRQIPGTNVFDTMKSF